MTKCLRCHVSGRVQGVWYRASTQEQAVNLGLKGYARNLADGRVEVLACGDKASLVRLQEWLWQGPPAAQVSGVACREVVEDVPSGFTTD